MKDRDRLWTAAHAIIEGLGPKFGMFKGQALSIAYSNISDPKKLTDAEVANVLKTLKRCMDAP